MQENGVFLGEDLGEQEEELLERVEEYFLDESGGVGTSSTSLKFLTLRLGERWL